MKGEEGEGEDKGGLANEEIDKMKFAALRAVLNEQGLRWTSVKTDLVQRLTTPLSTAKPG